MGMGNEQRAIEVLQEAVEKDSRPFHALADIAEIYLRRGDYEESSKWAKKSSQVNPYFIFPIAIQIVIRLIRKEDEALVPLIRKIEPDRRDFLRKEIQSRLKDLRKMGYGKKLEVSFTAAGMPHHGSVRRRGPRLGPLVGPIGRKLR